MEEGEEDDGYENNSQIKEPLIGFSNSNSNCCNNNEGVSENSKEELEKDLIEENKENTNEDKLMWGSHKE